MEGGADHVLDIICVWSGNTVAFYVLISRVSLSSLIFSHCFVFLNYPRSIIHVWLLWVYGRLKYALNLYLPSKSLQKNKKSQQNTHKTTQKQPSNNKTNKQATKKSTKPKNRNVDKRGHKSDDHPASHLFWELGLYAHIPYIWSYDLYVSHKFNLWKTSTVSRHENSGSLFF